MKRQPDEFSAIVRLGIILPIGLVKDYFNFNLELATSAATAWERRTIVYTSSWGQWERRWHYRARVGKRGIWDWLLFELAQAFLPKAFHHAPRWRSRTFARGAVWPHAIWLPSSFPATFLLIATPMAVSPFDRISLTDNQVGAALNFLLLVDPWPRIVLFLALRINPAQRTLPHILIHRRPVHQPERVGLNVAPRRRVVVAHPVLVEAGFALEPLAGEAGGREISGGGMDPTEG